MERARAVRRSMAAVSESKSGFRTTKPTGDERKSVWIAGGLVANANSPGIMKSCGRISERISSTPRSRSSDGASRTNPIPLATLPPNPTTVKAASTSGTRWITASTSLR